MHNGRQDPYCSVFPVLTLTEGRTLPPWIHNEAQWVPNRINAYRSTPRHVIIKMANFKTNRRF